MAKIATDLEQSKKLAEILPLESADMLILNNVGKSGNVDGTNCTTILKENLNPLAEVPEVLPCWSLAAMLGVLPQGEYKDADLCCGGYKGDEYIPEWFCSYEQQEPVIIEICHADNPVDACYELILKLHGLNLL